MFAGGMWVIYLEMLLAFGLAAFIVWWTLPAKGKPQDKEGEGKD